MATHFKKQGAKKGKSKAASMNDFLDRVITANSDISKSIIENPKNETEKEYRFIATKLGTLRIVKAFVAYLHAGHLLYSREVLGDFIRINNIDNVDVDDSEEEEEEAPTGRRPRQARTRERDMDDGSPSGSDESEDEPSSSEDEDDENLSPELPPPPPPRREPQPPTDERIRLENERILFDRQDKETQLRLEALHKLRRENPAALSDADVDTSIRKLIEAAKTGKDKIARSRHIPNMYREDQLKTKGKLTVGEEQELNDIVRDRERFDRGIQGAKTDADQPYTNRIRQYYRGVYRDAEWMRQGGKFVTDIYVDSEFVGKLRIGHAAVGQGQSWFLANNNFFSLMAMANMMKQTGNILHISSLLNGGVSAAVIIRYRYNTGDIVEQDEVAFGLMQKYIKMLGAPPSVRKDAAVETAFLLTDGFARSLGRSRLVFPGGDAQEERIAMRTTSGTVKDYFYNIINISAYLNDDSIFKRRLVAGCFARIDLSELTAYDKIDYEELTEYYERLVAYELDAISWLYFSSGGKFAKLAITEPVRPHIADENGSASSITFPPRVGGDIISIVGMDMSGKPQQFVDKILKMNVSARGSQPRTYKKTLWDIVDEAMGFIAANGDLAGWVPAFTYETRE